MQQQQLQPQFTFEGGHLVMYHQEATGLTAKDATVNDRDRMQDLLTQEKYLTTGYNISMNEASHEALFQVLKQNSDTCHQLERQVYQTMFKKGWYRIPVADAASVAQTHQQFTQYKSQFPMQSQSGSQTTGSSQTDQKLNQAVNQAIQQAQQGQVPSASQTLRQAGSQQSSTQATMQAGSKTQGSQQLNQRVEQAIRQAEQGKVPSVQAPGRTQH